MEANHIVFYTTLYAYTRH